MLRIGNYEMLQRDRSTVGHRPPNPSIQVQILVALPLSLSDYDHDPEEDFLFCEECGCELIICDDMEEQGYECPKCRTYYQCAGVAQMIEQGSCKPQVAGLIPVAGSSFRILNSVGRVSVLHAEGREFKSLRMHQIWDHSLLVRTPDFQSGRVGFNSHWSHQTKPRMVKLVSTKDLKSFGFGLAGSSPAARTN